ncbi:hypothetical protein HHI36_006111 [Cryptolaemus montrouzieri]|uniref:Uncharacterized protein n=1 Tax=Cryptolaemus montrouzieri TaxID=559131 RepID=A0ABD2NWL0_9CUCU
MNRADPDTIKIENQLDAAHTISRVKGDQLSEELYERLKEKYKSHLKISIRKRDLQMLNSDDNKNKAVWIVINEKIGKNEDSLKSTLTTSFTNTLRSLNIKA